jgi:hypothetical protein
MTGKKTSNKNINKSQNVEKTSNKKVKKTINKVKKQTQINLNKISNDHCSKCRRSLKIYAKKTNTVLCDICFHNMNLHYNYYYDLDLNPTFCRDTEFEYHNFIDPEIEELHKLPEWWNNNDLSNLSIQDIY